MPLVLPEDHPVRASVHEAAPHESVAQVRIGIVNIMPMVEAYEPLLLGALSRVRCTVEPVFVRLETHAYRSSDQAHLDRFYRSYAAASADAPLDGLIITGAPVEEIPFTEVHYWAELADLLTHARSHVKSTLGICWGGMALGALVGIPKALFPQKLFGVFENRRLVDDHPILGGQDASFLCAHSRHSGAEDIELERAETEGRVRLLSHSAETGYSMFETPDHRFVMHFGHPEYVAERIAFEWNRDRALGRKDVPPPRSFDPEHPTTTWQTHRDRLFESWVDFVAKDLRDRRVPRPSNDLPST